MKTLSIFQRYCTFLLIVLATTAFAKVEITKDSLVGSGQIVVGTSKTISDKYFTEYNTAIDYTNFKVSSRVALCIDPKKVSGTTSVSSTVELKIDYNVLSGGSMTAMTMASKTLTVIYNPSGVYTNVSSIDLGQAYNITVKVLNVSNINASIKLISEIYVERYYALGTSAVANLRHSAPDYSNHKLPILWNKHQKAEYYELEWAYVDHYMSLKDDTLAVESTDLASVPMGLNYFKNNSTRIVTPAESYEIPLAQEKIYLLYRIRAVSFSILNGQKILVFSPWTTEDNIDFLGSFPSANRLKIEGLEDLKNWQASVNFAEEGKNKVSIKYADGTLRERQSLVRLNTENKTLVGDQIYDHQGRVAITTLPVPTSSSSLIYKSKFSQNNSGGAYNRTNFDLDPSASDCNPPAQKMNTTSGASQYYSTLNPFGNAQVSGDPGKVVHKDFIPQAGGYPFAQTVYMPDHTNRVAAISMPGDTMMIGSGHEQRMFYGTPTQEELIRLFGHEVGNAMHYKKNLVRDANGQYAVSYIDMQGKTIATSLAGDASAALAKLPSNTTGNNITSELLGGPSGDQSANKKTPDGKGYEFNKSLPVIGGSTYKLTYKATAGNYQPDQCNVVGVPKPCYSCVLDVETSFKEKPCADNKSTAPSFNLGKSSTGTTCITKDTTAVLVNQLLDGGSYVLSKKVKVNEKKLDEYTNDYLKTECVKKLDFFVNQELAKADPNWCGLTCEQCQQKFVEAVGNYDTWSAQFDQKPLETEYTKLRDETCSEFCEGKWNVCSAALKLMLADMSPMGQYGEIYDKSFKSGQNDELITVDASNNIIVNDEGQGPGLSTDTTDPTNDQTFDYEFGKFNPDTHSLSIYNEKNVLPTTTVFGSYSLTPTWRFPIRTDNGIVTLAYLDEDKKLSVIPVVSDGSGGYIPEVKELTKVYTNTEGGLYILPQNLKNTVDFTTKYWRDSWAYSLVMYHPEYEYYKECINNKASNDFDQKWNNANTLAQAEAKGLIIKTVNKFDPSTIDPYFVNGDAKRKAWIKHKFKYYTKDNSGTINDIWTVVNKAVNCPTGKNCSLVLCSDLKIDSDQEWLSFKGQYMSLKQEIAKEEAQKKAIVGTYYNGCIGNEHFNTSKYGFNSFHWRKQTITITRACNTFQRWLGCTSGPVTYTVNQPYVPVLDVAQTCNYRSSAFYIEKTKRFWQEYTSGGNLTNAIEQNCFDTVMVNGSVEYIPVRCQEDLLAVEQELRAENTRKIYSTCGVCPAVWDLQHFLGDMAKQQKLTLATTELSCPPTQGVISFTPLLERLLVSENAALSSRKISYQTVLSSGNKALSIKLVDEGAPIPSQPQIVMTIASDSPYNFTQLIDICCMQVLPTANPSLVGKLFSAEGIVMVNGIAQKVPLQGTSLVALSPCEIPPRCLPSNKSVYMSNFLNALIAQMDGKVNHLLSSTQINLMSRYDYNTLVRRLEDQTALVNPDDPTSGYKVPDASLNYKWSSSLALSGTKLVGTLTYNSGTKLIELTSPSGASVDFTKIIQFSNIRMKKCMTDGCTSNQFTVDALFRNGAGDYTIVKLDGNTSYIMGNCKQAIQFESQR